MQCRKCLEEKLADSSILEKKKQNPAFLQEESSRVVDLDLNLRREEKKEEKGKGTCAAMLPFTGTRSKKGKKKGRGEAEVTREKREGKLRGIGRGGKESLNHQVKKRGKWGQ